MKSAKQLSILTAFLMLLAGTLTMRADLPFRQHRFSGFKSLPICQEGDIVFIGNSITNMLGWYEALGNKYNVHGRGNSGGYAEEVLDNLQSMISGNPSKVFLMIGTNNLGDDVSTKYNTPEKLAPVIEEILTRIREQVPEADVYYESILPTLVGSSIGQRTKAKTEATNKAIEEWIMAQNDSKLHYIDLYSKFVRASDGALNNSVASQSPTSWSYDGLHLTQKGYKLWIDEIAPLLGEGYECVFPAEAINLWGGLGSSNGMRVTYFGATPTTSDDILIFGDENICSGEWHELLGSADFKNRGVGWGYSTAILSSMSGNSFFKDAIKGNEGNGVEREDPKAVIISAGAYEIQGGTAASVFNTYKKAVDNLRTLLPETPIFVCTLAPASKSAYNSKIETFNDKLKETYGSGENNVIVVDIHSAMLTNGERNHDCFMGKSGSATDSFYYSGIGYVKFAQKLAEVVNENLGTQYKAITDEEMDLNLKLYEVLTGIYNNDPNAGNPGEPISGDQVTLFKSLLPDIRAKLTRGTISEFFEDLEEAYEYSRNEAEPAPELAFVTKKIVIEPGLDNGNFYKSAGGVLSEEHPWPYNGTFIGVTGNCFLVSQWESLGGEVSITSSSNDSPGQGYNNNLWYFEMEGFAASGNPNATVDDPYIYVFGAGENYKINRIHFRSRAMQSVDQIWVYDGEQYVAKAGGDEVEIDIKVPDSQEVWLGLVGQNQGASMSDFFIELSETIYEGDCTIVINGKGGSSYTVNNTTGEQKEETSVNAGLWISHNDEAGVTLRGKNANAGFNNIFNCDSEFMTLNNGNSSIDIIYELECDKAYEITGIYADLYSEPEGEAIPWLIQGKTYLPTPEGTHIEITDIAASKVTMDPGSESTNPIVPTYFKNFYLTVATSSGVESILSPENDGVKREIYTIDGMRVTGRNLDRGIYIIREGNNSRKVIIR